MNELKTKLHKLIEETNNDILLENIYNALLHSIDNKPNNKPKDWVDELSPCQLNELDESVAQYKRGETMTHEEVLQMLKHWKRN